MYIKNNEFIFSPSDLMVYFKSPFELAMKRYWLENPELAQELTKDPLLEILAQKGYSNELNYLTNLKSKYSSLVEINRKQGFDKAYNETLNAVKQGVDIIYQGALLKDNIRGYCDFLIKTNTLFDQAWSLKITRNIFRFPSRKSNLDIYIDK